MANPFSLLHVHTCPSQGHPTPSPERPTEGPKTFLLPLHERTLEGPLISPPCAFSLPLALRGSPRAEMRRGPDSGAPHTIPGSALQASGRKALFLICPKPSSRAREAPAQDRARHRVSSPETQRRTRPILPEEFWPFKFGRKLIIWIQGPRPSQRSPIWGHTARARLSCPGPQASRGRAVTSTRRWVSRNPSILHVLVPGTQHESNSTPRRCSQKCGPWSRPVWVPTQTLPPLAV